MDHGPFSAVELLQQIASNQFVGEDILRDELTGVSQKIDEWDEFSPFAQHAGMHRNIAQEKKEVAKVESAEKKAGAAKFIIGGILAVALVAGGALFVIKKVGERKDGGDLSDDPNAVDLSGGGSLKGGKKARRRRQGRRRRRRGGGGYRGGGSYEAALDANNQEISMGGPKGGPDLTDGQLGAPMRNASFISGCGAPDSMKVTVRVAVQNGRAVGVSVYPNPPNPARRVVRRPPRPRARLAAEREDGLLHDDVLSSAPRRGHDARSRARLERSRCAALGAMERDLLDGRAWRSGQTRTRVRRRRDDRDGDEERGERARRAAASGPARSASASSRSR